MNDSEILISESSLTLKSNVFIVLFMFDENDDLGLLISVSQQSLTCSILSQLFWDSVSMDWELSSCGRFVGLFSNQTKGRALRFIPPIRSNVPLHVKVSISQRIRTANMKTPVEEPADMIPDAKDRCFVKYIWAITTQGTNCKASPKPETRQNEYCIWMKHHIKKMKHKLA